MAPAGEQRKASSLPGPAPLTHGYAEQLQASTKAPAVVLNQPYRPIQPPQNDAEDLAEIEMFVGESRVFPTPGVGRIAVGNGAILTAAALDHREVILFANAVGTSSLFVWNEDGRYQRLKITIVPGDTSRYAREISAFLAGIPGTRTSIIGDKVIVEGEKLSDLDIAKIDELSRRYPQIVNFTNRLGWEQMVLLDVKVVEFPINELRELGLKWNAMGGAAIGALWKPLSRGRQPGIQVEIDKPSITPITGDTVPLPSALNSITAINMGLAAQLQLLSQNGKASVLAEPQLSARNGSKASFLAGGEYPYTISTINGPSVYFKQYGIKLDILPRVDSNGVVRATIDSEVSAIDPSVTTTSGPALSTRKTSTEFNVQSGDTLVLAGLISRKTSTNIDKVPGLGDLPILGALFRSKRFQNDETELVVFVTPSVVDSRSPGLVERVQRTTGKLHGELGRDPYLSAPEFAAPEPETPQPSTPQPGASEPGVNAASSTLTPQQATAASTATTERQSEPPTRHAKPYYEQVFSP